jgi:hypothetical protein
MGTFSCGQCVATPDLGGRGGGGGGGGRGVQCTAVEKDVPGKGTVLV